MYKALEKAFDEYLPEDIERMVAEKRLHHLQIAKVEVWVSKIEFPRKNILFIHLLEGTGIAEDLEYVTAVLTRLAKAWGCSEIRAEGRNGWERILSAIGAKKIYTVMSLEVV